MSAKDYIENVLAYPDDSNVKSDLLYFKEFQDFLFELYYSEHFDCLIKFVGGTTFMEQDGGWTFYSSSESAMCTLRWKGRLISVKKYLTE
ncbi:hypothetical protein TAC_0122 [Acinetobacter phage TAC1]|nr:hypothetical protein TAC_0122 [Acinetobacter phage TAC1]